MSADMQFDAAIAGPAAIGSAYAAFPEERQALSRLGGGHRARRHVQDPARRRASGCSYRQQFSTARRESGYRASGWNSCAACRARHGPQADPAFHEDGYGILASEQGHAALEENHRTQIAEGAPVALSHAAGLVTRFPWLATEGIAEAASGFATRRVRLAHVAEDAARRRARCRRNAGHGRSDSHRLELGPRRGRAPFRWPAHRLRHPGQRRRTVGLASRRHGRPKTAVQPRKRSVLCRTVPTRPSACRSLPTRRASGCARRAAGSLPAGRRRGGGFCRGLRLRADAAASR